MFWRGIWQKVSRAKKCPYPLIQKSYSLEIISKSDDADEKRQVYHNQGHLGFSVGPNEKFYSQL